MTRTQWFPASIDPVHPGEYENQDGTGRITSRNYWNGKEWRRAMLGVLGKIDGYAWRGLADKPCAECHGKPTFHSLCECLPF